MYDDDDDEEEEARGGGVGGWGLRGGRRSRGQWVQWPPRDGQDENGKKIKVIRMNI